jgi:5-(carboxyamino)imidazole ribonucleotide synthase
MPAKGQGHRLPLIPGPNTTLGVVGGGQLGRMFAHAAQRLGFGILVLDPVDQGPAGQVSSEQIVAAYDDPQALLDMARRTAACTTEFESVPAGTMAFLAEHRPVAPPASALAICQHRAREKSLFESAGVPCAPYVVIADARSLQAASQADLFPGILKTTTLGYDGKGQTVVKQPRDLIAAWKQLGERECVLEQRLALALEFSLIVARGYDGHMVTLPTQQNLHRDGILAVTEVPAPDVTEAQAHLARAHVQALATTMNYVGVLCVEFFVLTDGRVVANEMAPRPHNSGHPSMDACDVSQFELQVRTLAGLPLTSPRQHSAAIMLNLLGDLWFKDGTEQVCEPNWPELLALPGVHLHLYGKATPRPGRKMGHVTITASGASDAKAVALRAAELLELPQW